MRKKNREKDEELNFWQPASDMFSALLLVLMLVILLLGLYLVHIPEYHEPDPYAGDSFDDGGDADELYTATPTATAFIWWPDGGDHGDGGGGETPHPTYIDIPLTSPTVTASPSPTVSPTPDLPGGGAGGGGGGTGGGNGAGEGIGDEPDQGLKSAVYVMLVDAETDRTVKEEGVQFELYGNNDALQILNAYYPERISYRFYETTDAGTFYFPEKLQLGGYELHELTEPEGYDAAENVIFDLGGIFDWPEPYVVKVPVYPSRNVVRVQLTDVETGRPVSGGSFEVIADENIITADGTLRYRTGQTVTEFECDEGGYGVSEEIYLGQYILRQKDIPAWYAGMTGDIQVAVEKKSDVLPPVNTVLCSRTRIRFSLSDELYPNRAVGGAAYRISDERGLSEPMEKTTDTAGRIILDELEKGTTYRIRQTAASGNYQINSQEYMVTVGADGYIAGETEVEVQATNRMIRAQVGITDEFSSVQVPGVSLALYTPDGALIRTWTTSGNALMFTDLAPGRYYLIKDGDQESRYDIYINDQADIQNINIHTTYVMQYVIMGVGGAVGLAVIVTVAVLIGRRRRKKQTQQPPLQE